MQIQLNVDALQNHAERHFPLSPLKISLALLLLTGV